jgi:hypothetical protein
VSEDLDPLRDAGLSDGAILDAAYVCVGFNIIARIADALGFKLPTEELFAKAAKLLVVFGYKRLSGFWTNGAYNRNADLIPESGSMNVPQTAPDPYDRKMRRLRHTVLAGPGTLPVSIRQAISESRETSGVLGSYATKVAECAYLISDDDIAELHLADYSDDQIFEATVSAALGAGILRLECVLNALRAEQPHRTASPDSSFEEVPASPVTADLAVV